ncbi:hypothetical protein F4703DRAFT_1841540, partial [Phycomyces blakesleeanus]
MRGATRRPVNERKRPRNKIPYVIAIFLRVRTCLAVQIGGRICLLGLSQKSIREWAVFMYGIRQNTDRKNSIKCPRTKSTANSLISTILHRYSRRGCEMAI